MAVAASFSHPYLPPLLGREVEVELVLQRLTGGTTRLLTLVGPGGVGKTRLAQEVVDRVAGHFRHGTVLVDLASLADSRLVLAAVAQALGLDDRSPRPLLARLQEYLAEREMLLVLDNFEHLLPAAIQLPELLTAPALRLLVTSRVALPLRQQQAIRLFPLPVPDPDRPLPVEELAQIPSVALFVERAQAQRPDFALTERRAPQVVELLRLLDGLPLALELAAGQMQVLALPVIVRRLEHRLASLRWEAQDLPKRQQSLQAAIGWSYDLLPTEEQRLFRHLGVFAGRVTPAAMASLLDQDEEEVLSGLIALAEKSLLLPVPLADEDAEPDFGMLETIREYAREQLEAEGELEKAAGAHAAYLLALAEAAEPRLQGPEQEQWLARLESQHDNLRGALGWAREHGDGELGLRLASALGRFWELRGHLTEARTWLETMLEMHADAPVGRRSAALDTAGWLAFNQADYGRAQALHEESLALRRELGDRAGIAASLHGLGTIADRHGDVDRAVALLEEALALRRDLADRHGTAMSLTNLGALAGRHGEFRRAEALFEEALALLRELGDRHWTAAMLSNLGILAYWQGVDTRSQVLLEEALTKARTVGSTEWFRPTVLYLGHVASRRGDVRVAAACYRETIQLCRDSGDQYHLPYALEACAWVTRRQGGGERAAQLYGAAAAMRSSTHVVMAPHEAADREHRIAALRQSLGSAELEREWAAGERMPPGEAIALALELLKEAERRAEDTEAEASEPAPEGPLSPREQQVIRLMADGFSNKQIAKELFVAESTVRYHVTSIFNKLGVDNRAHAVAVASREGIL
ncbi:MAG TPA: tetratricopeptide repeat protein [Chloroflexota bacterium]|nr:tetratricopeptide repeat protein [Chloroflexota bacterium]